MSVSTEISRIQTARNTIRAKLVELGLSVSTATLDVCAAAIANIINQGAVNASVQEGETYTIPAGFHNGTGVVAGVAGGGNYSLQEKTATPTKKQQSIVSDAGYYGLSGVTVEAIPENYQDVSATTATAGNVLSGKVFVLADGTVATGTMANNGAVNKILDTSTIQYTIVAGYHSGTGKVSISLEEKSVTPTKNKQTVTPSTGKVISRVTVDPIPDEYQDVTPVTTTADKVLEGSVFVDAEGSAVEGSMPNNGDVSADLDASAVSKTIPAGYTAGGIVKITTEAKSATPTKAAQNITPSTGKVLTRVTVNPIPDAYQDVTPVTATAAQVLDGAVFVDAAGAQVPGSMPNNGAISKTIDGLTNASASIPAGYTAGGIVSLTSDIEDALADI